MLKSEGDTMRRINQTERQNIITLAALQVSAQRLSEDTKDKKLKANCEKASKYANAAMNNIIEGADPDQLYSIQNILKTSEIRVMPISAGKEQNMGWVNLDDLNTVVESATSDCTFCDKSDAEVKGCKIRKALFRMGFCGENRADCPFKGV